MMKIILGGRLRWADEPGDATNAATDPAVIVSIVRRLGAATSISSDFWVSDAINVPLFAMIECDVPTVQCEERYLQYIVGMARLSLGAQKRNHKRLCVSPEYLAHIEA
jgi:hypothetical protein